MLDCSELLKQHIAVLKLLNTNSDQSMLVGGCVREFILHKSIENDVDISTTLLPNDVFHILKAAKVPGVSFLSNRNAEYGTIVLHLHSFCYEITTTRSDILCTGRHAKVEFCKDFFIDSQRRDFTFNALYLDVNGNLHDFHNGLHALHSRNIQFIGSPSSRIQEDYLRIIRYYRFQAKINATADVDVSSIIKENINGLHLIAKERIKAELLKMLSYQFWYCGLDHMIADGVWQFLFVDEIFVLGVVSDAQTAASDYLLKLYQYFNRDCNYLHYIFNVLGVTNNEKRLLVFLSKIIPTLDATFLTTEMKLFFYNTDIAVVRYALSLYSESMRQQIEHFLNIKKPLPCNGDDIAGFGFIGKDIGVMLKKLQIIWIESDFSIDKEKLLQQLK